MRRNISDAEKYTTSLMLAGALAGMSGFAMAQISQQPLSLTEGVPPNMIFTLDDSGSMRWAFAPDNKSGSRTTRRAKSNTFNPMYYDPAVTYVAPKVVDEAGEAVQLSTSFATAYNNGFDTDRGSLNLADGYKVSWTYRPSAALPTTYGFDSTSPRLAENPAADFYRMSFTLVAGSPKTYNIAGQNVTFSRTANTCSFSPSDAGLTCTRVSGDTFRYTLSQDRREVGVPAYYYKFNSSLTDCDGTELDDRCYQLVFVSTTSGVDGADERQNFANWYSFYRNRALATLSAASLAFFDLSSSVRLTWQGLGNCDELDGGDEALCKDNRLSEYSPTHKGQFYAWLKEVEFDQSTYLPASMKRAGEFLKGTTAWQKYPHGTGNSEDNLYACRPSYHITMTDGLWNQTVTNPSDYRQDQDSFTLPDDKSYSERHPFYDSTVETLADLAMHYWSTDLQSTVENKIPSYIPFKNADAAAEYWDPRNNPATWQHMVNFLMGLGLTESLNNASVPWDGSTFAGSGYEALTAGTADWPAASSGSSNNVYDLWHAAINSRGEFFSVDNPDSMVRAFKSILDRIAERMGSAASPAINSGQLEEAGESLVSYAFHTYYYSNEGWAGDLKAYTKRRQLNEDTGQYEVVTEEDWSARALLDSRTASRNITMAGTGSTGLQPFVWSNAGDVNTAGTLANMLRSDLDNVESPCDTAGCAEKRLSFLRGDRADEGTLFRQRQSILGDFVSSKPVSVRGARYLVGYANSIERNTEYSSFQEAQETREPRIYVGANDGMLHAFDAVTGEETFAFVPTAVFPNLYRLTGKTYNHHFYVDGSPVVADVYIGGEWRTVLVGTLRAGGKGLFALDITDPDNISLLWEFDDSDIPAADEDEGENLARLGYSFPQPTIARLHNGKWAVVTGNGYDSDGSTHGKAALLIIDLETGALTQNIEVQGEDGVANGLSSPRLADMNIDGVADYAYAGDLQGNLWRFNLTPHNADEDANPFTRAETEVDNETTRSHFKASYDGEPLFSAVTADGEPQAITAAPNIVRHPSRNGYLVVFGTGKYYETPDKNSELQQSLYGIWDTNTRSTSGDESGPGGVTTGTLARSQLQEQTYDSTGAVAGSIRTLSRNSVKWAVPPSSPTGSWTDDDGHKYGWYFDLSLTGEMVIENMILFGQSLLMQTLVPDDDPCESGASSWTYGIDALTGGRTRHHIFRDVRHPEATNPVTAVKQTGEGGLTLGQRPDGSFEVCTGENCLSVDPDPESVGRQSWRQVGDE